MPNQGFQTQVYDQPAAAVAGNKASKNPTFSYDAGPGGLIAGPGGVFIGRFCWVNPPLDPNGGPSIAQSSGAGPVAGFVMGNQQGLQTNYLANAGMLIQQGYEMAVQVGGDFWILNTGTTQATRGMKAYANYVGGSASFAASGNPTTGASATGSSIAAVTSMSVTGSIAGDILTVATVGTGPVYPGTTISGSGVASGTQILNQINGTANGAGQYYVSIPEQAVASTTITGTYGVLTIGTLTTTPVFQVGDQLNATGSVVAGTQITANITGSGGAGGTMVVNNDTVVTSQTIAVTSNVETPWYALNSALPGELVKISDHFSAELS